MMTGLSKRTTWAAILLAALVSCGKPAEDDPDSEGQSSQTQTFAFAKESIVVGVGQTVSVGLVVVSGTDTLGAYDLAANPMGIVLTSSAKGVATVGTDGVVTGVARGTAKVSAYSAKLGKTRTLSVTVGEGGSGSGGSEDLSYYHFNQDLSQNFSLDNIFLKDAIVHATMQGLDVTSDGTSFISWEEDGQVHMSNGNYKVRRDDMVAKFASHGDGFFVEEENGQKYVWCSASTDDSYAGQRFVVRYKFEKGKTVYPEDCDAGYYWGNAGATVFSLDAEHGYFAYQHGDAVGVYKYSEMKAAPIIELNVTRSDRKADKIKVHDLTKITPVAQLTINREQLLGIRVQTNAIRAVQGFCTYDQLIYLSVGFSEEDVAHLSIIDFKGQVKAALTPIEISRDKAAIKAAGLTEAKKLEQEGLQIHRGVMYVGFVGDFSTAGENKHACILKLN